MKTKIKALLIAFCMIGTAVPVVMADTGVMKYWDDFEETHDEGWNLNESEDWSLANDSGYWALNWTAGASTTGIAQAVGSGCPRAMVKHYVNWNTSESVVWGSIFVFKNWSDYWTVKMSSDGNTASIEHWNGTGYEVQKQYSLTWKSDTNWNPSENASIVKMYYNSHSGNLRWKIWNLNWSTNTPSAEPTNWTFEYQHKNLSMSTVGDYGLWANGVAGVSVEFGNFHVFKYTYDTEVDSEGENALIKASEVGSSYLTVDDSVDAATSIQSILNKYETSTVFYDQSAAYPNDTVTVIADWNRTSIVESGDAGNIDNDLLILTTHVTPDYTYENETVLGGADYCWFCIDRDHNHEIDSGDLLFKLNAANDRSEDYVNGTFYVHNGTDWVEQKKVGGNSSSVFFYENKYNTSNWFDWSYEELFAKTIAIGSRHMGSTPMRAKEYEQWELILNMDKLFPNSVNSVIENNSRVGFNTWGYGTLTPYWSWAMWNESTDTYEAAYLTAVNQMNASRFGNLGLSGNTYYPEEPIDLINLTNTSSFGDTGVSIAWNTWWHDLPRYKIDLTVTNATKVKMPSSFSYSGWILSGKERFEKVEMYEWDGEEFKQITTNTVADQARTYSFNASTDNILVVPNPGFTDSEFWYNLPMVGKTGKMD